MITRRVLVLCSNLTNSRAIEEATRPWMFETVVCSSLRNAQGALAEKEFSVVFCEDRFEDGNYADLLSAGRPYKVPVVVMMSDVEQDAVFREAMALGALGVVGSPCSIKDAQWMLIRASQQPGSGSSRFSANSRNRSAKTSNGLPHRE